MVENEGEIVGCGALHLYGMHLAEIRSITVTSNAKGKGAGRVLVDALLKEARHQSVTCVCLFTRIPDFFARMGFRVVDKGSASGQGAQGLSAVSASECLRRDCDVHGHSAEGHGGIAPPARSPALRADCVRPAVSVGIHRSAAFMAASQAEPQQALLPQPGPLQGS